MRAAATAGDDKLVSVEGVDRDKPEGTPRLREAVTVTLSELEAPPREDTLVLADEDSKMLLPLK